ncbi:superoxide dismutase [Candidatus Phytoplasma solani]|uniref:superoxide dismutase n=1 Tax=Candidatus Phytoplasma solani TaxID=69896 RepID=UPI0032DB877B
MHFTLPHLHFSYDALEPFLDKKTMELHHSKHHQTYVNNLNDALKKYPHINFSLEEILTDLSLIPQDIRQIVRNNGGGHLNHSLFWNILKLNHGTSPQGLLKDLINRDFGSLESFKNSFRDVSKSIFGSGWAWLILNHKNHLEIVSTFNQDVVLNQGKPLLALDVWEHAYYLNYQNRRIDYIEAFFNVIDWKQVETNLKNNYNE